MKTKLNPTRIKLPEKTRREIVVLLNQRLADLIDLGLQIKQAHWNVKGANFISLHQMFDKMAEDQKEFVDAVAERAVTLGGTAFGTLQAVASTTTLGAYPIQIVSGKDHVMALIDSFATFAASARSAIDVAAAAGDADTADLFTGLSRLIDQQLWFLEATSQSE